MFKLGIQIYSVRDEYAQNPLSCFRQMKQCGYDGAELFGSIKTHPAEQLKAWLEEAGLEICGYHTQVAEIREDIDAVIAYNRTLGNRFVIVPAPAGPMSTAEEWVAFSRELNGYKAAFADAGFRFGFHSHRNEVLPVDDGSLPWDIVAANTDDDVILQIDMGNTLSGGVRPEVRLARRDRPLQALFAGDGIRRRHRLRRHRLERHHCHLQIDAGLRVGHRRA